MHLCSEIDTMMDDFGNLIFKPTRCPGEYGGDGLPCQMCQEMGIEASGSPAIPLAVQRVLLTLLNTPFHRLGIYYPVDSARRRAGGMRGTR